MGTNISHSPSDTIALGEAWGRTIETGLVIGLCGDLGAGKTQLVKGLARGLGIESCVHSPTFALVNVYTGGRLALFHLDLYRLETTGQIIAAGLEEYLNPDGVSVIEWADRWFGPKPGHWARSGDMSSKSSGRKMGLVRWVQMEILGPSERRISYEDLGA
jgi:tRNA threonylcarbamoyladenosine biosynthesis protein TsaE